MRVGVTTSADIQHKRLVLLINFERRESFVMAGFDRNWISHPTGSASS